jgi:hypothetical protein
VGPTLQHGRDADLVTELADTICRLVVVKEENVVEIRENAMAFMAAGAEPDEFTRLLGDDDDLGLVTSLLGAGHHSSTSAMSSLIYEVFRDPAVRDQLLADPEPGTLIYTCGPEPLLNAVEGASDAWPEGSRPLERFKLRDDIPDGPGTAFDVVIRRSGPEHRDSVLTPAEQAANDCMMICCSRARAERLVLEL